MIQRTNLLNIKQEIGLKLKMNHAEYMMMIMIIMIIITLNLKR